MWNCTADFSGGLDVAEADVGAAVETSDSLEQCPDSAKILPWHPLGSKIEADNGIGVEVADIFIPDGEQGIACFHFWLGDQRLTSELVCVQNSDSVKASPCWNNSYKDYGVEILFRPPDKDGVPLKVISNTYADAVKSPVDLYEECAKHDFGLYYDNCLKFVPHDSLKGEETLTSGIMQAFFPAGQADVGTYYFEQLGACQDKVQDILGLGAEAKQASVRYLLREPQYQNGGQVSISGGMTLNSDYIVIQNMADYADEQADSLLEYTDLHDGKCRDGMVLHEEAHASWLEEDLHSHYFWGSLQEGAARFIENNYPVISTPKVYLDAYLNEGDKIDFQHGSGEDAKTVTLKVEEITPEEIGLSLKYKDGGGYITIKTTAKPGFITATPFYNLVVDQPAINDTEKAARFRMVNVKAGAMPWQMKLVCRENSYDSMGGLTLDGVLYPWDYHKDIPYGSLAGEFNQNLYDTGACFFEGIRTFYEENGGDFQAFFPKLTASIKSHASQPLPVQYKGEYCVLDEIQKMADDDLGIFAIDVKEYAKAFGYDDQSPWCVGLKIYKGDTNNLGDIL